MPRDYQSGTGRKTFRAKSMCFGRKSLPPQQFHYGWIVLQISFFTEYWKVLPSILMTSFGWETLPKQPFHGKFDIRSAVHHRINGVISMFPLHKQSEKSCFYLINLIGIYVHVTVN